MGKIQKLDSDVIDQIAAGEVVDRPASVLKELLENAIDAGSTKISVKLQDGGIKCIEVSDNGVGIDADDLEIALDSHTTSKIRSADDIASVMTLGFRGEALSSIAAVSKVTISSMARAESSKVANEISAAGSKKNPRRFVSREFGTTVRVEDIFYNIPARRKFLKTPKTEYAKLLDVFIPLAIINPQIHLVLINDGKTVYNLPAVDKASGGMIHPARLGQIMKKYEFVNLFYDGEGITVGGVVAHPKHHTPKTSAQYCFVNGRAIWDNGIAKSVALGASRFIPDGQKVPFAVALNLNYSLVDVNVHPRKTEVRFANPYRIYSAVELAVKKAYESTLQVNEVDEEFNRFREKGASFGEGNRERRESAAEFTPSYTSKKQAIEDSLRFSRMILQDSDSGQVETAGSRMTDDLPDSTYQYNNQVFAKQFLGRYIVSSMGDKLLIIDQHAAAERIRFERLLSQYAEKNVETQQILTPVKIELGQSLLAYVEERAEVFRNMGYDFQISEGIVEINGVPSVVAAADHETLFQELAEEVKDLGDVADHEGILRDKYRDPIIATLACHSSVRMNQRLSDSEAVALVKDLMKCKNSYSCPHGRPIIWELGKKEMDTHFERKI